jgi:hypothetical protein
MLMLPQAAFGSEVSKETLELIENAGGKEDYPDADALIILSETNTDFNEDGTACSYDYGLTKILTEAGIKKYAEKHLQYYRVYDTVLIKIARVIKQDGSVVDVPEDDINDISSAEVQYMNIYEPEARDKVIMFKNLEVGDCIEYHYLDSLFNPPMDGNFDGGDIFQATEPILRKEITVTGPKGRPLKYVIKNGEVDFERKEEGDRITYRWHAEDVPKIVTEPAMPSLYDIAPLVIYTTVQSWEEISRWWGGIAESKYEMSDELRAEVMSLTADKTTRDEKVDAIYHFVAQKVRYMGLGTGKKKGFEPKPACRNLRNQVRRLP